MSAFALVMEAEHENLLLNRCHAKNGLHCPLPRVSNTLSNSTKTQIVDKHNQQPLT